MKRAWVAIREQPWYRREAFSAGLKRAGFEVRAGNASSDARPGDVLLQWNRYGGNHEQALAFERRGGLVLVAENGYIGRGGSAPKFDVHPRGPKAGDYYALAKHYHNGAGEWRSGGPERLAALGIELKPWRAQGSHVLVCPNRSFGVPGRIMPVDWAEKTAARLRRETKRPVTVRSHPGNDAPKRTLADDLAGAWAMVIWSSSSGVHALAAGIPVFCEAPFWIMKGASAAGSIDEPVIPERRPHFERMAWAQWTLAEIESGAAFGHLLCEPGQGQEQAAV